MTTILANSNQPDTPLISPGSQDLSESSQAVPRRTGGLPITPILIAVNFLVFWAMLVHRSHIAGVSKITLVAKDFDLELLRKWGGDFAVLTLSGQYWRPITALFLHHNYWHLILNMLFLWRLGTPVERLIGRTNTLAIYLLTGVASSLVGLGWHPLENGVGASGAIYGLAGVLIALLGFAKLNLPRRSLINILLWVVLLIGLGFGNLSEKTTFASHMGGLVGGFAIGALLAWTFRMSPAERAARHRRLLAFTTVVLVVMFAAVVRLRRDDIKQFRADAHAHVGSVYLAQYKFDEAAIEYRLALEIKPGDPSTQYYLANAYFFMGRDTDAISLFRESLSHGLATGDKYAQFARVLLLTHHRDEAEEMARKAVALDSKSSSNHELLAVILLSLGKREEAERERKLAEQIPSSN